MQDDSLQEQINDYYAPTGYSTVDMLCSMRSEPYALSALKTFILELEDIYT